MFLKTMSNSVQHRTIWSFVYTAFNQVDIERQKMVSPDRLCAEWILRNGGQVTFSDRPNYFIDNYNMLPREWQDSGGQNKLETIDANGIAVMSIGFDHLLGCRNVKKIILHNCSYMENDALAKLCYVRQSLKHLEIIGCPNIENTGLLTLYALSNLEKLVVANLPMVENYDIILKKLKTALPKCDILKSN